MKKCYPTPIAINLELRALSQPELLTETVILILNRNIYSVKEKTEETEGTEPI